MLCFALCCVGMCYGKLGQFLGVVLLCGEQDSHVSASEVGLWCVVRERCVGGNQGSSSDVC